MLTPWSLRTVARLALVLPLCAALVAMGTRARADDPPASASPAVARGHAVFDRACARCHADDDGGPDARITTHPLTAARMTRQIRHGSPGPLRYGAMPAIGRDRVSDADLGALYAYLRAEHAMR